MSANESEIPDPYAALAERVTNADETEIWNAFGQRMDALAREGSDNSVVGFVLNVSTDLLETNAPLGRVIHIGYRQFGRSRDSVQSTAVARNADVYATRSVSVKNPARSARRGVVDALRNAADSDE